MLPRSAIISTPWLTQWRITWLESGFVHNSLIMRRIQRYFAAFHMHLNAPDDLSVTCNFWNLDSILLVKCSIGGHEILLSLRKINIWLLNICLLTKQHNRATVFYVVMFTRCSNLFGAHRTKNLQETPFSSFLKWPYEYIDMSCLFYTVYILHSRPFPLLNLS